MGDRFPMNWKSPVMTIVRNALLLSTTALIACSSSPGPALQMDAEGQSMVSSDQQPRYTEGKDYQVLERRRFLDEQGFDRPVEAFSVLVPRD